jgi:hypothetical protein
MDIQAFVLSDNSRLKPIPSKDRSHEWLHKNYILDIFSEDKDFQTTAYRRFISIEDSKELIRYYSKKNISSILGSEKFIKWVKDRFPKKKKEKEIPESKKLCP